MLTRSKSNPYTATASIRVSNCNTVCLGEKNTWTYLQRQNNFTLVLSNENSINLNDKLAKQTQIIRQQIYQTHIKQFIVITFRLRPQHSWDTSTHLLRSFEGYDKENRLTVQSQLHLLTAPACVCIVVICTVNSLLSKSHAKQDFTARWMDFFFQVRQNDPSRYRGTRFLW